MKNVNIERRKLGSIEQRAMVDGVEFPDKFGGVAAVVGPIPEKHCLRTNDIVTILILHIRV